MEEQLPGEKSVMAGFSVARTSILRGSGRQAPASFWGSPVLRGLRSADHVADTFTRWASLTPKPSEDEACFSLTGSAVLVVDVVVEAPRWASGTEEGQPGWTRMRQAAGLVGSWGG